ncbi:hypothetical protein GCM10027347_41190 [Larkinella harenae]
MGKRLIRIRANDLPATWASEKPTKLINAEVNVVFIDGRTLHGNLTNFQESVLLVRDNRGHAHTVALETVDEVILDAKAPY